MGRMSTRLSRRRLTDDRLLRLAADLSFVAELEAEDPSETQIVKYARGLDAWIRAELTRRELARRERLGTRR